MARRSRIVMEDRDVRLATAAIAPENIRKELARFARRELANVIASGEASPIYTKFVNGREGAEEETVEPPGPILYEFSYWRPIIEFVLQFLERRSPVDTGRYQSSHKVMLGSQFIEADTTISAGEEVTVVATVPYSRKIEVGFMRMSVPDGVYQDAMRAVQSQFRGMIRVKFEMIMIPNGYILKGRFRRGYKPNARRKLARDTQAGARMTYPALRMTMA
ncbi:MAG: hypothetical protein MUE84_08690 [Hyphomonas sp.]|jgi:hypothetical protein|nr:hypothetical protein [Hyphomonas sp.]